MPDRRRHRGPHPQDRRRFAQEQVPALREAAGDLAWLLGRGYPAAAALKLVGDRLGLDHRQRLAVQRATCSDAARDQRARTRLEPAAFRGQALRVDGFNVLTTVESALAGGVVLLCRDGAHRDMASMHGTWRRVEETGPALLRVGGVLEECGPREVVWYLDRPVSNSGRLKGALEQTAAEHGWPWRVEVVPDPDRELRAGADPVATADSAVLDAGVPWLDLARLVVLRTVPDAWIVDLGDGPADPTPRGP